MAKFAGLVGYVTQEETTPGVWSAVDKPMLMRGDVLRQSSSQNGNKVNMDVTLSHRVSLIANDYALKNHHNIKWIELNGQKWTITSVEIQRPRIIVTLGGLWNA